MSNKEESPGTEHSALDRGLQQDGGAKSKRATPRTPYVCILNVSLRSSVQSAAYWDDLILPIGFFGLRHRTGPRRTRGAASRVGDTLTNLQSTPETVLAGTSAATGWNVSSQHAKVLSEGKTWRDLNRQSMYVLCYVPLRYSVVLEHLLPISMSPTRC